LYIESIKQENMKMPIGPVITTPNKLWNALAREVIIKRPETFKITILHCIRSLFPESPFCAGFGNRPTDCESYKMVGIEPRQCYRINPRGEMMVFATSEMFQGYVGLCNVVEERLPRIVSVVKKAVNNLEEKMSKEES
jgi:phosphatidate phosphatase LPIN